MSHSTAAAVRDEDREAVCDWFRKLAGFVNARDFESFRALTHEDFVAFGTVADFVSGRDTVEWSQWRSVWPRISDFRFRLDGVRVMVSPDRLLGAGLAIFDSTGYHEDGTPFDRPGRATVIFDRATVRDPWIASHTHMSLFRDVPSLSHGRTAA